MNEKPTHLTAAGKRRLEEELDHLRTVRRAEVAIRIREAKDAGDITENAAYETAKNEQAFVEGRIRDLKALLREVVIIPEPTQSDTVCLGSRVTVAESGGSPETFYIVGVDKFICHFHCYVIWGRFRRYNSFSYLETS